MLHVIANRSRIFQLLYEREKKYPRTYNILRVIVFLLLLICVALFFGNFLALLERNGELDDVYQSMKDILEKHNEVKEIIYGVASDYEGCVDSYILSVAADEQRAFNGTELKAFIQNCTEESMKDADTVADAMLTEDSINFIFNTKLNWNRCDTNITTMFYHFIDNVHTIFDESLLKGMDKRASKEIAFESARDEMVETCTVNTQGGAWFWFTIMTTIGYGNTAPVTAGGRVLVFTAGFLSVIAFAAVLGMSGNIVLAIVDDFFLARKWEKVTKGWVSVIFWLVIFFLHMFIMAGVIALFMRRYNGIIEFWQDNSDAPDLEKWNLRTCIWFSFITFTTIGFGDYYIPHTDLKSYDIWYLGFFILLGFVFFANFALKFGDTLYSSMKRRGIINDNLLSDLLRVTNQQYKNDAKAKDNKNDDNCLPSETPVDRDVDH